MFTLKEPKTRKLHLLHLPYYNNLHTEYLASYTNALQPIEYQYFTQCKMLPIPPAHILHNLMLPHGTTREGNITA